MMRLRILLAFIVTGAAIYSALRYETSGIPEAGHFPLTVLLVVIISVANVFVICGALLVSKSHGRQAPNPFITAIKLSVILVSVIYLIAGSGFVVRHGSMFVALYVISAFDANGRMAELAWKYRPKAFRRFPESAMAEPYQVREVEAAMATFLFVIPCMSILAKILWGGA